MRPHTNVRQEDHTCEKNRQGGCSHENHWHRPGKCERMDSRLSHEVPRPVLSSIRTFSMNSQRKDESQSVYTVGSQRNLVPVRSKQAYFKRCSPIRNRAMIILVFLVALLFIVVLVLSVLYSKSKVVELCDSEDCMRTAASLKVSMDLSVDPCDDFYKYTCGRWSNEHPIPDSSFTNSWFSERSHSLARRIRDLLRENITKENAPWAVNQAKVLHTSCMDVHSMDTLGLSPLFELLEYLDLPRIPAAFANKTGNYIQQTARIKRTLGKDIFVGLDVVPDPRNKSRNIMLLGAPDTSSPLPNDLELEKRLKAMKIRFRKLGNDIGREKGTESDDFTDAEVSYMSEAIRHVLSNGTIDDCSVNNESITSFDRDLEQVVDALYELDNVLLYLSHNENNESISEDDITDADYMLLDDLQRITDEYVISVNSSLKPRLFWRPFIEFLFEGITTMDLKNSDRVLVANLGFMKEVALVLALANDEELETYIWWVIVDIVSPHSSEGLRKIWSSYVDSVMDIEVGESKSLQCASVVNRLMGMATSWMFVDPSFHDRKGGRVLEMLEDIRQAFAVLVMRTDWMDQKTKHVTLEKNRRMGYEIGFPKWLFDEGPLDDYYEGIDLSETKYLDNMVQIIRVMTLSDLECIHEINYSNESYWASFPTDVNAYHTFQVNQITIPAGILQFPFYDLGLEALNYGAIGAVLGHELTHGFDSSGRHYDSDGNLRQWWTNETISEYTERTDCFIRHYNGYYEVEVDDYVNGELTLGENIADNGGLREAAIAYGRWKARHGKEPLLPGFTNLTHEQLFFLAFAHLWCESYTAESLKWMLQDTHCPGHVRLTAVLRNSKEFSEAWNCPEGSNMNPSDKCHLW